MESKLLSITASRSESSIFNLPNSSKVIPKVFNESKSEVIPVTEFCNLLIICWLSSLNVISPASAPVLSAPDLPRFCDRVWYSLTASTKLVTACFTASLSISTFSVIGVPTSVSLMAVKVMSWITSVKVFVSLLTVIPSIVAVAPFAVCSVERLVEILSRLKLSLVQVQILLMLL